MSSIDGYYKLLARFRARYGRMPKHFEMSAETLRVVEKNLGLDNLYKASTSESSALWGIKIVLNEKLPLNEIKPIYE